MYLTYSVTAKESGPMGFTKVPVVASRHGLLEAYVCHRCGLVEWYCPDAQAIPNHPNMMTELVDYDADASPYRG